MKINIKTTNVSLTPDIKQHIDEKIGSLKKFFPHDAAPTPVWVEIGLPSIHHRGGDIFRAEVRFYVLGHDFFAEAVASTLLEAIDQVREKAQRELTVYKERHFDKRKTLGQRLKRAFRRDRSAPYEEQ